MEENKKQLRIPEEFFAHLVAGGMTQSAAYKTVFPGEKLNASIIARASVYANNPLIKERIEELKELQSKKNQKKPVVEAVDVLQEIKKIAFSSIVNITNEDGTMKLPHQLDAVTAAAISSFKIDQYGSIEYKFCDKNTALEKLAKHLGLYAIDNSQKVDPLAEVISQLGGRIIGPLSDFEEDENLVDEVFDSLKDTDIEDDDQ